MQIWIENNPPKLMAVFTDSLAAVQTIADTDGHNSLALEIKRYLKLFSRQRITVAIVWIPGHVGLRGNERADRLAKIGLQKPIIDLHIPLQLNEYLNLLNNFILNMWQNRYNLSKVGLFYKSLVPKVSFKIKYSENSNRKKEVLLTRVRFGHCLLNNIKHLYGLAPSKNCDSCLVEEDVTHFIIKCISYHHQRCPLMIRLSSENLDFNIENLLRNKKFYNLIWKFLHESKKKLI